VIAKEFRALMWPWLTTLALLAILPISDSGSLRSLAVPAYFFGAAALCAMSVGHEYSHRTLGMMLAQPVSRATVLRAKLIVLLPMLAAVVVVGWLTWPFERGDDEELVFWIPIVSLCVGPWLTMICRNAIGGAVFAVGIPGGLLSLANLIDFLMAGTAAAGSVQKTTIFWIAAAIVAPVGAALGVKKFLRLEAVEGRDPELHLPQFASGSRPISPRIRGPVWMLIEKELRLQQMTFAVSAVYLLQAIVAWTLAVRGSRDLGDVFEMLSVLYGLLIAPLIGSLASAEERHLGTLDWQVTLPFAAWIQWTIKVAVALALSVTLSIGLPALFANGTYFAEPRFIVIVLLITSASIYVSSRSASSIQAMVASFALLPIAALLIARGSSQLWGVTPDRVAPAVYLIAAAIFLYSGLAHHRSSAGATR
jgi:hypothetical protein